MIDMCFLGDGMPLPREQDILATAIETGARGPAWPTTPLAAGQASASLRDLPAALRRPRHHRHVLHAGLQRQSELASHSIAIIPELLRGGTVQDTDLRGDPSLPQRFSSTHVLPQYFKIHSDN